VPDESPSRWRALIGISVLSFVVFMDFTVVTTILPGIVRELPTTVDELQWVMNATFRFGSSCSAWACSGSGGACSRRGGPPDSPASAATRITGPSAGESQSV
jgi:hypothetical protein